MMMTMIAYVRQHSPTDQRERNDWKDEIIADIVRTFHYLVDIRLAIIICILSLFSKLSFFNDWSVFSLKLFF